MKREKPGFTALFARFLVVTSILQRQQVRSQFCDVHVTTWDSLIHAINENSGIVFLCPFNINGDKCPTDTKGYEVQENSRIQLLCEPSYIRDSESACVIDCPGTHFEILPNGSLVLDGITHRGATTSAIRIQSEGSLTLINSVLENNYKRFGNGGAINAMQNSIMDIEFTRFQNNQGLYGGAIFHFGGAFITGSTFLDNKASDGGGGAIYTGSGQASVLTDNIFAGNEASLFGPAVFDGTGAVTSQGENSGCENLGPIDCDGVSSFVDGVQICQTFSTSCIAPTSSPTAPTSLPSMSPSSEPSKTPSALPSGVPSSSPSTKPSPQPSAYPSISPSFLPSATPSLIPSNVPSSLPSLLHSSFPTATSEPSNRPSSGPSFLPSPAPSLRPSIAPTRVPTVLPSQDPTVHPSLNPTIAPTNSLVPTTKPTEMSSALPTLEPTITIKPSNLPSDKPSISLSTVPSQSPSISPTSVPSVSPSQEPTSHPSLNPTIVPTNTLVPTSTPTEVLSALPTLEPSFTIDPSYHPSNKPSTFPSAAPSPSPSLAPTSAPTLSPTQEPSLNPSFSPSATPSTSLIPTIRPSEANSSIPSSAPSTNVPSLRPSEYASPSPSSQPSFRPSKKRSLSILPSTVEPSAFPSEEPSVSPSHMYYSLLVRGERIESGKTAVHSVPEGFSIRQDEDGRILVSQETNEGSTVVWEKSVQDSSSAGTFYAKVQGDCNFLIKQTDPLLKTRWSSRSSQHPKRTECGLAVFPAANPPRIALYKGEPPYDDPENQLWWEPLL